MNDDQFEQLLLDAEGLPASEVTEQVEAVIRQHKNTLSESQQVDLLYLEYLARLTTGDSHAIEDLCSRYPQSAAKLKRQAEVDTELSRLEDDTEPIGTLAGQGFGPNPRGGAEQVARPVRVGEYTIIEKIGEGAQAEVFRVIHPVLRCELAMKVARCPTEAADRILDEGRLLITINDPGIARVIDAGLWQDRPFIVSELVRGVTLKQRINDRTLAWHQIAEIVIQISRTVQNLHAAGIVHCDIKPANVLVDAAGNAKLVDFGLAIDRRGDAWDEEAFKRSDHSGGTLVYMAPELFQMTSEPEPSQSRRPVSDVFSLGGLLYFGLVGDHPYASASSQEIIARVTAGKWDHGALLISGAPPKLIELCEASMAVSPQQRIKSAEQFGSELERLRDREGHRSYRYMALLAVPIVALVFVGWFALRSKESEPTASMPLAMLPAATTLTAERLGSLDVKIWAEDRAFELVHRVPVSSGEGVQINAPLRGQHHGELWLVSSEGNAERLAVFPAQKESRWVQYPDQLDQAVPLTGPAGTEAIVWLEMPSDGDAGPDGRGDQIAAMLRPAPYWPSIDAAMVFRLVDGKLSVEQDGRAFGAPQEIQSPSAVVQKHLRQATEVLNGQSIGVEIVAFSHSE